MTRIKKWKLILAAMLAALCAVTFGLALHLNTRSASAEADGVLEGNTAEYTFENGTDTASQWVWHADTNEWLGEEGIYQMTEDKTSAVFKLIVTKPGVIAFEWKLANQYITSTGNKLHVVYHKSIENTDTDVVPLQTTNNVQWTQWNSAEVEVQKNDTLTFTFTHNSGSFNPVPQVWVRGLKKPSMDCSIMATAGEGGAVKSYETTSEIGGSITVDVPFGESFYVEAVASSGYVFTYWTDKNDNNISSNPKEQFFYAAGDVKANFVAESETVEVSFTFDTRYGKMYLLQNTEKANLTECIENGLPLEDDVPIKIKKGTTIVAGVECLETVQSTIDPLQTTSAVFGGWKDVVTPLDITYLGSTNPAQAFNIDQNGINYIWQSGSSWYTTKMEAKFKEIAPIPKVFYTATIDSASRGKAELHDKDNISLNFEQNNDILFEIEQNGFEYNDKFALTINGESTPIVNDGDRCGFTLNGVNENKTIVITPDYGEKYLSTPIEFSISILLNKGIDGIVLDSSSPISVENDPDHPWYFDPARDRGDGYAFTSGISYLETITTPSFSQLKFTVTGNGSLTFEYHIDGYALKNATETNHNSWAAYSIGKKVDAAKCTTGTATGDWRAYGGDGGGFKSTVATNLGYGNSYMDYKNVVTYYEPGIYEGTKIPDPEGAKESEKYWYKVTISIEKKQDTEQTDIYIAHAIGVKSNPLCANMTVRNVAFYKGNVNVNWAVNNAAGEAGDGSNKINVSNMEKPGSVAAGTSLEFTAVPAEGYTFYGWKNETGKILSYDTTYKVTAGDGNLDIRGVFDVSCTKVARIGDTFYEDLQSAIGAAQLGEDKKIIVVDNITIANSLEIPADVSLVIPLDREGNFYKKNGNQQPNIAWTDEKSYKLWNVTVSDGATLTVSGKLYVGGVLHSPDQSAQAHTSGAYSELVLDGNVIVEEGGVMDVYGRVTGKGGITVKSGGVLYQPFLILDYAGGNNTYDLFYLNQTPFKRYAMINIQCEKGYTIEYGGELYGHASLYFLSSITTLDTQFISYVGSVDVGGKPKKGTTTLINLTTTKSKATGIYKDEKFVTSGGGNTANIGHTTLTISGGAKAGYMNFLDMVQTNNVAFSIPYNYSLMLENGEYDMSYDYKLMPGASLTVAAGATLNLNAKFYVYDGLVQSGMSGKAYPTATELSTNNNYSTNANFIVNGTLNINQGATFLGVIQTTDTTGKAKIVVAKNGDEREGKNVTLTGKIVDGGLTSYDCNQAEYDSSARIWIKTGENTGKFLTLEAGKTYVSTSDTTFDLPQVDVMYDDYNSYASNTAQNHIKHGEEGSHWVSGKTDAVKGLKGSWMVEHGEAHEYDWTPKEDEKPTEKDPWKTVTRTCTVDGCDHKETKYLLYKFESITSQAYKGTAFTEQEIAGFFKEMYENLPTGVNVTCAFEGTAQNASTYTVTVTLENAWFLVDNETTKTEDSATFQFTVTSYNIGGLDTSKIKAAIEEKNFTYDGNAKSLDNDTLERLLQEAFGSDVLHEAFVWNNNTAAGENSASVTITGTGTNFMGTLTVNFSIAKAKLTVAVVGKSKPYDGSAWADVENAKETTDFTVTSGEIYNKDDIGLKLTVGSAGADVNDYTVTGAASNSNYDVTVTPGTYKITRAALTVTIESKSHTYGETPKALAFTITGFKGSDTEETLKALFELKSAGATQWADYQANGYAIQVSLKNGGTEVTDKFEATDGALKNYTVKLVSATYMVEKQDIGGATFTVNKAYTYDGTEKKPTMSDIAVTWTGYADSDHAELSAQFAKFTVGNYSNNTNATNGEKASLTIHGTGNFTGTKTVNFEIKKATVDSITVEGEYAYNGSELQPTIVVKAGSLTLATGDYTVTFAKGEETEVKNAGDYTVTVALTDACKNYKLGEIKTTTFTVAKADITITADNQHTAQGEEILSGDKLTWTVTNTAGGKGAFYEADRETLKAHITVSTTANKETVAQTDITIGWLNSYEPENYNVTFKNGTYSVDDTIWKNVSVTGADTFKYDGTVHTLAVTVGNETLNGKTKIEFKKDGQPFDGATDVGTYEVTVTITATGYTSSFTGNYTIIITAREVIVTFDPASSTYGDAVKTSFQYKTSGDDVLAGDNEKFEAAIKAAKPYTDATKGSTVSGTYKITTKTTPTLANYTITVTPGVYTITARPVEVTVNKQTVTYNQQSQSASSDEQYWSATGLASGDDASVLNVALAATGTAAGNYDITATWNNGNYDVTFKGADGLTVESENTVKAAFVIEAAKLTAATANGSYTYDGTQQTPTFTVKAGTLTVEEGGYELVFADGADRVSAGTVNVTIRAKGGNYKGEVTTSFEIKAKKIKVTLTAQTAEYSGQVPTPAQDKYTVNGDLCSKNGVKDDLGITITLVNGNKDHGDYALDATATNKDYEVEFDKTAKFTVTKKQITVKADDLESIYGENVETLTYTANGLVEGEKAEDVLTVNLQASSTIKEADTYTITGTGSAKNYTFTVQPGTYKVKEREITVKINDKSVLYDGIEPTVSSAQGEGWTITKGNVIDGDNLMIKLTKAPGVNARDYEISGTFNNKNYKVTFEGTNGTAGKFTIQKRAVTVVIEAQSAIYDPAHNYAFVDTKWHVKEDVGDGLAQTETKDVLAVTLTKPDMTDVGTYDITGAWTNGNYDVTFEGGEDAYTVNKLDVTDIADDFFIMADEATPTGDLLTVTFAGDPITIAGFVSYNSQPLNVTLSKDTITEIGEFEVTVTVEDTNYSGSKTFRVVVKNADGYTKRLTETIAQLAELAEGMTAEAFTAEDFAALKQMKTLIDALDEDEKTTGAAALAPYEALISAWNEAVEGLDEKIETAQSIGDALLGGLIGVTATLSALAAVAYVFGKGGIL